MEEVIISKTGRIALEALKVGHDGDVDASPVSASVYLVSERCEARWLLSRCLRPPPCLPSSDTTLSRE